MSLSQWTELKIFLSSDTVTCRGTPPSTEGTLLQTFQDMLIFGLIVFLFSAYDRREFPANMIGVMISIVYSAWTVRSCCFRGCRVSVQHECEHQELNISGEPE
jgi:hypothetical protein